MMAANADGSIAAALFFSASSAASSHLEISLSFVDFYCLSCANFFAYSFNNSAPAVSSRALMSNMISFDTCKEILPSYLMRPMTLKVESLLCFNLTTWDLFLTIILQNSPFYVSPFSCFSPIDFATSVQNVVTNTRFL